MKENNSRVTYISEGKLRFVLDHKFTNHARLSVKFTPRHILFLALKTPSHYPF